MSISGTAATISPASASVRPMARDLRLDFFRGLALLMIFVDHVAGNGFAALTLRAMGFADAAEVFVFIAGMAGVYAYRRVFLTKGVEAGVRAVFARIRTLYLAHMLTVAGTLIFVMMTTIYGTGFDIIGKLGLQALLDDPLGVMIRLPLLAYLPHYLDILPLYVLLLAALPAIILGMRVHALAPLAAALLSYAFVHLTGLNMPNLGQSGGWYFNPFAWILLFTLGATAAQLTIDDVWARIPRWVLGAVTATAAAYAVFAFLHAAPWRALSAFGHVAIVEVFSPEKSSLSWHRLMDILAKVWLVGVLVRRDAVFMASGFGGAVSRAGRHSLPIFVAGTFLSILGSVVLFEVGGSVGWQFGITAGGIAALLLMARAMEADAQAKATMSASRPRPA